MTTSTKQTRGILKSVEYAKFSQKIFQVFAGIYVKQKRVK
jgi:hypothetical protein